MGFDPEKHHRRSIRMKGYDYSFPGTYFVTLLSHGRECIFGEIKEGMIRQSDIGELVNDCWLGIPNYFDNTNLDEFVLMPNHLHSIIFIHEALGKGEASPKILSIGLAIMPGDASPLQPRGTQSRSLSAIIQNFKSVSSRHVNRFYFKPGNKIWQRNYYERIIRNARELNAIREYIRDNPLNWELDKENPTNM